MGAEHLLIRQPPGVQRQRTTTCCNDRRGPQGWLCCCEERMASKTGCRSRVPYLMQWTPPTARAALGGASCSFCHPLSSSEITPFDGPRRPEPQCSLNRSAAARLFLAWGILKGVEEREGTRQFFSSSCMEAQHCLGNVHIEVTQSLLRTRYRTTYHFQ